MSNPYWVKTSGLNSPFYTSMTLPGHEQSQNMAHQQSQNLNWQNRTPKASGPGPVPNIPPPSQGNVQGWSSWNAANHLAPPPGAATPLFASGLMYDQRFHQAPLAHPPPPQQVPQQVQQSLEADPWEWGSEDTTQAQPPQTNNNFLNSFQADSSWNWGAEQRQGQIQDDMQAYSQMNYSGQYYGDQLAQNSQTAENVHNYPELDKPQSQDVQSHEYAEEHRDESTELLKTDDYESSLPEPAMSDISKNSMTPQWSIESQMSQDSDDISPSLAGGDSNSLPSTVSLSPVSAANLNKNDERNVEYGQDYSQSFVYNSNPSECVETHSHADKSFSNIEQVDRHSNLTLDETIAALETLNVSPGNREVVDTNMLRTTNLGHGGPPPPLPSGPPMTGGNPYSNARTGLSHKTAAKFATGGSSSNTRKVYGIPAQEASGSGAEIHQANLETSPDNHEQPDKVDSRLYEPPAGQETTRPNMTVPLPTPSWPSMDNQEVVSRPGPDRNQYLETGQLTGQSTEEESAPPPGLHRLVTGQMTEQDAQLEVSTPPPGLDRMIPGQLTENENSRMVPGRMTEDDGGLIGVSRNSSRSMSRDQSVEPGPNMRRMVPGHTDSQLTEDEDDLPNPVSRMDDPPPGLHRMVPGESSSPESQVTASGAAQNAPNSSGFQPIEPRVVTGVSRDAISQPVPASPVQKGGKPDRPTPSPDCIDGRGLAATQPPSERSETIGSDGVDAKPADSATNKKTDRRHRDDKEDDSRDERDHPRSREYYRRDRDSEMDRERSPSDSGSNRYREDREWDGDRDWDRRYDSPEGRSRYRDDRDRRSRDRDHDRDYDRRYDSRRDYRSSNRDVKDKGRRAYGRPDDDGDEDGYNSDRDNRKRDRNQDRDADRERIRDRDRNRDREHDRDRDSDRDRERDRRYGEDSDRHYYRDRDRPRERGGRDRGREETEKPRKGGRYSDNYYHNYEDDYYRDRRPSRPSSRTGSLGEYSRGGYGEYPREERGSERHKHSPYYQGGYYFNPQEYYRYQAYYNNLRKTDPEAYAAWYRKYYSQYAASQPGTYDNYPEDRGSVHSGRSSANEELTNDRYSRHRSPDQMHRSQNYYHKSPHIASYNHYQESQNHYQDLRNASPFSRESGRGAGHGESSLDDTISSVQRLTPFKFSTAHVKGVFTKCGHMLKVLPHYPVDGQPGMIEMHNLQSLLPQDAGLRELLALPGPLVQRVTHKKTIILYLRSKMEIARNDPSLHDRQSVILLYELLILLLRQNGVIVGTDIAELLLRNGEWSDADDSLSTSVGGSGTDHRAQSTPSPSPSAGSRTSSASAAPLNGTPSQMHHLAQPQHQKLPEAEVTTKFRDYLLYGNTKEALEWAMKHGLWGHALFLSSKLDQRMYHSVMTRFANGLALTDPLQTLYQLLSGWQPAAVTCVSDEKWGDWRPHLAMILSNTSPRPEIDHKAIMTLADTLGARGCLHASHFCYLMAQHPFGTYAQRTSKLVLLGSSHAKPFSEFANTEAIMITSIYEYACSLADPAFHIPNLQPYKYLMATRLVEAGLLSEAVHYCEVLSRIIAVNPQQYDRGFVHDVAELGESLKYSDPYFSTGEDPDWLTQIQKVSMDFNMGMLQNAMPNYDMLQQSAAYHRADAMQSSAYEQNLSSVQDASLSYSQDGQLQSQEPTLQEPLPQHQFDQSQQANNMQYLQPTQQLQQTSNESMSENYGAVGRDNWYGDNHNQWYEENDSVPTAIGDAGEPQSLTSPISQNHIEPMRTQQPQVLTPPTPKFQQPPQPQKPKTESSKPSAQQRSGSASTQSNSSWLGGLWNKLAWGPKNQMKLPDDKNPSIVWDDKKKRWVNTDADGEEDTANLGPPPKLSDMPGRFSSPAPAIPTNMTNSVPSMGNGSVAMNYSLPTAAKPEESADNAATKPPAGPNMFKLPRGRSLKASYVDVMNPGGVKASGPTDASAPELFPSAIPTQPTHNYFIPAAVEGNENMPVDFLTPAPAPTMNESVDNSLQDQQQLSRWSSASSLSREVQSYTRRRPLIRNQGQPFRAGPQMYNPAQFSQQPTMNRI